MQKPINLPELQSVNRITNLPLVETGWNYAEYMYQRIKHSNNLLHWTLDQAESSLYNVIDTASPAVFLLEGPLTKIDMLLCKSLDLVEQKVPSINLPPQMIYSNTKQYVSDVGSKIVRPVLKRADSVKHIGNQVLESKFTAFAADKLDGALSVADMYVDKYLPADDFDKGDEGSDALDAPTAASGNAGKALHTSQHMFRFSNKLGRRLTRRTLLEAKALKDQSAEAIHVLVYVAELIATDPKLALQKGKELWATLSQDEPENQARPDNLEQLIVLLTRETARRVVHLINFSVDGIGKVPRRVAVVLNAVTSTCLQLLEHLMKSAHMDSAAHRAHHIVKQLNMRTTDLLEQFSLMLSPDKSPIKATAHVNCKANASQNSVSVAGGPPKVEEPTNPIVENALNAASLSYINASDNGEPAKPHAQDSLRPPSSGKTQLKATHQRNNTLSNGESTITA